MVKKESRSGLFVFNRKLGFFSHENFSGLCKEYADRIQALTGWCFILQWKGPERQMISMLQVQFIRRLRRNGESIASIARKARVSEPTMRKYLGMEDWSERPPVGKGRGSMIDPYLPLVEGWLAEDRGSWRKQRHTATRIRERLRDEHGAEVFLSTVTRGQFHRDYSSYTLII